ncbi:MAG: sugar transferase [Clostridia bacterium]|nr:sugar transferase [Clostridia bacterium]
MNYNLVKRIMDVIIAIIALLLVGIPMIVIAIAIKLEDGQHVIFVQKRIGKDLNPFYIYKFRTMRTDREELHSDYSYSQMVTKVGKFLRKTSLDELPQIFNVLKGEMSFIGPRPWIPEYYKFLTDEQKKRNDVLPGISGLAQIKGRNGISIEEKLYYDLGYVKRLGLREDLKIIFLTVISVLKKDNAEISEKGIIEEIEFLKISFSRINGISQYNEEKRKNIVNR